MPSPCLTLSGGCLSLHWQAWRDRGADPWVVEVLREGCCIPFFRPPPLSTDPISMPSYAPTSIKGAALEEVTLALIAKGAVELAPLPSPGFYSRLFVVWTTAGSWHPVIDLSLLNRFVDISHFRMETIQSVLMSVRQGDWMASIDLREASLQVPVHPESRRFLRFVAHGRAYQFTTLCFGLSTAPQVFPRVMAPVSIIPWVSICVVTRTTGSSRHRPGRPSFGISVLSCPFVASWGSWSTQSAPTSLRLRWYNISGWSSTHRLL